MTVEINLTDKQKVYVENLNEIKAFPTTDSNKGVVVIKPEEFCFSEYYQYHFIGSTTAIVPSESISWVVFI